MSNNKKVLEEAVIEYDEILKAARNTAKDLLMSTFGKDIDRLVQESLDLEDKEKEDSDKPKDLDKDDDSELELDAKSSDGSELELDAKSNDDLSPLDSDMSDVATTDVVDMDSSPLSSSLSSVSDIDLTGASDDDVVQVFRKLKDEDTIEVVKDDNGISLKTDTDEFYIKLNENEFEESPLMEDDEIIYEIEMDDDQMMAEEEIPSDFPVNNKDPKSQPGYVHEKSIEEVARTHSDGRKQIRKPVGFYQYAQDRLRPQDQGHSMNESIKIDVLNTKNLLQKSNKENKELNEDLNKFKDALRDLRENMKELAVFNNNLAHSVKLFMEHATTKAEKESVIARFDAVNSINESKNLYKTISNEFKSKKPLLESVNDKIKTSRQSGASELTNIITESSDNTLDRTKELMAKLDKNFKI